MVKVGKNAKTGDHGTTMMFIVYVTDRESDSVRMWDPTTNGVVKTCDVIWMKQMYFTQPKDAVFDVESIPLDTDAKDVEDVIGTNDGSEIEEGKNIEIQPST